ncbi:MAG TPA: hypothetical protein PL017_01285 [Tenuifilaceae bacterium]|nr:hypothetical protein [Tenuifilaceae bacterium]HPE17015.1 hypothetical protein [Tenuifilaceae bacterium]HPJ44700.1 hypothetical protein [Tenuifilaceae bacterium]HPQ32964.1 hypothetical protein [Tenuifilaceae bacterium]HRX66782.1 hypothetical protein [Tenuifilaceae bacterium]
MKKISTRDALFFLLGALVMFLVNLAIDRYNESQTVSGKLKDGFKSVKKELKR